MYRDSFDGGVKEAAFAGVSLFVFCWWMVDDYSIIREG